MCCNCAARTVLACVLKLTHTCEIDAIDARSWNDLAGDSPFLRHEFLAALEHSGCVGPATTWQPHHLLVRDAAGVLIGALPLYIKYDSSGEFVFDWGWAHAYEQAGLAYYPKLVSTVPFTPATGRRLLIADEADVKTVTECLIAGARALCDELRASSLHVLFPTADEQARLSEAGLHCRKGYQFHWNNSGYSSFDEFLATFSSAKRKKARRERRRIAEAGIQFERLRGNELTDAEWDTVFEYYSRTFLRRGRLPYLNRAFFAELSQTIPANLLVVLARYETKPIASAICFRSATTLFGRYWGCLADFHSLHFETCYYQGIEYCIEQRLDRFEPGTQGEHKISRGFVPTETWSSHWLADLEFNRALQDLLVREQAHVDTYMRELRTHLPFKRVDAAVTNR